MRNWSRLLLSIVGCELVGLVGTPFTAAAIPSWYVFLVKPVFEPPSWIFAPVWTILYALMGISFYLIWQRAGRRGRRSLRYQVAAHYFGGQLLLNLTWSLVFFGLHSPFLGLVNIVALWGLIILTIEHSLPLSKWAGYLLIPYLAWVSFAAILNAAIVVLN